MISTDKATVGRRDGDVMESEEAMRSLDRGWARTDAWEKVRCQGSFYSICVGVERRDLLSFWDGQERARVESGVGAGQMYRRAREGWEWSTVKAKGWGKEKLAQPPTIIFTRTRDG